MTQECPVCEIEGEEYTGTTVGGDEPAEEMRCTNDDCRVGAYKTGDK